MNWDVVIFLSWVIVGFGGCQIVIHYLNRHSEKYLSSSEFQFELGSVEPGRWMLTDEEDVRSATYVPNNAIGYLVHKGIERAISEHNRRTPNPAVIYHDFRSPETRNAEKMMMYHQVP